MTRALALTLLLLGTAAPVHATEPPYGSTPGDALAVAQMTAVLERDARYLRGPAFVCSGPVVVDADGDRWLERWCYFQFQPRSGPQLHGLRNTIAWHAISLTTGEVVVSYADEDWPLEQCRPHPVCFVPWIQVTPPGGPPVTPRVCKWVQGDEVCGDEGRD